MPGMGGISSWVIPFYHPLLVQNNFRYRPIRSPLVPPSDPVYRIVDNPGFIDPGLNPNTPDRPDLNVTTGWAIN
jgi:hypothetical protein